MNTLIQSKPSSAAAPSAQATRLLGIVREIQEAAKDANLKISEIESRGWLKNLVASSRGDLVSTAKSQGRINDLFVRLNQEAIALNTLGYVYLASVIAEFERQVNEGVKGSDGRIHVLSENGRHVARAAKEMFSAILDSSRSTQEKIDTNAEAIVDLRSNVDQLANSARIHTGQIEVLQDSSSELQSRAEQLGAVATQHREALDGLLSELAAANRLAHEQADGNSRTLQRLEDGIESVSAVTASIDARTSAIEEATDSVDVRLAEQIALTEKQGGAIAQAAESLRTLLSAQSESGARLNVISRNCEGLEERFHVLLAETARLSAGQATAKSRLHKVTWAMGIMIFALVATCIVLGARAWHFV